MPKIYEYFGITFLFFSKEHSPIHLHIKYGKCTNIAKIYVVNGKVTKITWTKKRNNPVLPEAELKKAKELVDSKKYEIIKRWYEFFVLNKKIKPVKITKKLK